jgi:2-amino-4-hydroxy-6-hydroxymethyldihydropteridine diphosphokinase
LHMVACRTARNFRTLDLDLLLYGDLIVKDGKLQIPREDIERYAFVLEPLAEIAPTLKHPVLQLSYEELWQKMPKLGLQQRRINKL